MRIHHRESARTQRIGLSLLALALLAPLAFAPRPAAADNNRLVLSAEERRQRSLPGRNRIEVRPEPEYRKPQAVHPVPVPREFRVDIRSDQRQYREGERMRISYRSDENARIYIFNTDVRGVTRQIFPNYYDRDNYARAGRRYHLPNRGYQFVVSGPSGTERLEILAVREGYGRIHDRYERKDPFPICHGGVSAFIQRLDHSAKRPGRNRVEIIPEQPGYGATARDSTHYRVLAGHGGGWNWNPWDERPRYHDDDYEDCDDYDKRYFQDVKFKSDPDGAQVFVNGRYIGKTPEKHRLPGGRHLVEVRKSGYRPERRYVTIRRQGHDRVNIYFDLRRYRR